MKIFEITAGKETVWMAAHTNIEALQQYCIITDTDLNDFNSYDEITELPESEWDKHFIQDDNKSFADWMKENATPDIISGTEWADQDQED